MLDSATPMAVKAAIVPTGGGMLALMLTLPEPWPAFIAVFFGVLIGAYYRGATPSSTGKTIYSWGVGFALAFVVTSFIAPALFDLLTTGSERMGQPSVWLATHLLVGMVAMPMAKSFALYGPTSLLDWLHRFRKPPK